MISIKDHLIQSSETGPDCSFRETANTRGQFKSGLPDTLVIHYTSGASAESSANWLCNKEAGASAHVVIGRKGQIIQLLPFNKIAWHAGPSKWQGRSGLNQYSIGIELANAGKLQKRADGYYTSFGKKVADEFVFLGKHKNEKEEAAWEAYTEAQVETLEMLSLSLISEYGIKAIVGHDDIAPTRKKDPGPAFPMQAFRDKVLSGRQDDAVFQEEFDETKAIVMASYLNIRKSPAMDADLLTDPLPQGTRVVITESSGEWAKVKVETEGWVSRRYLKTF